MEEVLVSHYEIRIETKSGITEVERYDTEDLLKERFDSLIIQNWSRRVHFKTFVVFTDHSFMEILTGERLLP